MKTFYLILAFTAGIYMNGLHSQCSLYPVSLSDRINNSSVIIEGKIINRQSFFNGAGNYMYTSNLVQVNAVLKGKFSADRVEIITEGGEIGLKKQTVEPSLQLKINDEGIFTLNTFEQPSQFGAPVFQPYADAQGFIKFNLSENTAFEPFRKYKDIRTELYPLLEKEIGTPLPIFINNSKGKKYSSSTIASVSGISPLNISAGTSSILTITGSGFGSTQSTSVVEFKNADDGGTSFIQPHASQYISWSNTQIQVLVPTRASTVSGTAGTGLVGVTVAGSQTLSAQTLTVDYGEINVYYIGNNSVNSTRHVDLNGSAGITWKMFTSFDANTAAKKAFMNSFQTWRCNTYINWVLGATTTTNVIAADGENVIRFDIGTELPIGVLGRCTSYFNGCIFGSNISWFISELDICFDDPSTSPITWEFGPSLASGGDYDFESVSLHELGHGHQLSHVINSNDVMHYALSNGQNKRSLISQDIIGGNDVMSRNVSSGICGNAAMVALTPSICGVSAPTASFNIPTSACIDASIPLIDNSTDTPTAWAWTMIGGSNSSSTLQTTSTSYTSAGNYSITLTSTNANGSSAILTQTIDIIATPTVFVSSATLCSGESVTLTATGANSYTWNPGNLTGASQTLSPSANTIYSITGGNGNCFDTRTTTLTVTANPTVVISNAVICEGTSTLITASGASTYVWQPGNLNGNSQNFNPSSTTIYTVTGTNANCVSNPGNFTVEVIATPTISISNATICAGETATLNAMGATNYLWNPGALAGATQTLNPSSTNIYTVIGSVGACSTSATGSIAVNTTPAINIPNGIICVGASTLMNATGATSYTWNPGNLTGIFQNLNPTSTSTYTVIGQNGSGCISYPFVFTITTHITPTLSVNSTTICAGSQAVITASGTSSYVWNPGNLSGASQTLNPSSTTVYTITGGVGTCISDITSTLTVSSSPTISVSDATICSGASKTITASGASNYIWNPGNLSGSSATFTPTSTTTYTVAGDNGECTGYKIFTITVLPTPTVSINSASICSGTSTLLTVNGANNYTWMPGNLNGSSQTLNPSATEFYTLTGNSSGCTDFKTFTISVLSLPTVFSISSPAIICAGNTSSLNAGGASSYTWTNGVPGFSLTGPSVLVNPTITTTYLVLGSSGKCTGTTVVSVSVSPAPTLIISPSSTICSGKTTSLTVTGAINYTWLPGGSTATNLAVNPLSTVIYTLTGDNSFGCSSTVNTTLTIVSTPTITVASSSPTLCENASATLTANGASIYSWSPINLTGSVVVVNPIANTNYLVTGTLGVCSSTAVLNVSVFANPTITISNPSLNICSGNSATLTGSGAVTYSWVPVNSNATIVTINPIATSVYSLIGTDANGCSSSESHTVNVTSTPTVLISLPGNAVTCAGETRTVQASGATNYTWIPVNTTFSIVAVSPTISTTYTLIGSNGNCVDNRIFTLLVNPIPTLSIPQDSICQGSLIALTASGAISYTWEPGTLTGATQTLNPSSTMVYTVSGDNSFGCMSSETTTLIVIQKPIITASVSPTFICAGKPATITASGAMGYTWTPGTISGNKIIVTPSVTSIYTVTGSASICKSSSQVTVYVAANPTVVPSNFPNSICSGKSSTISVFGAHTFTWNPGYLIGQLFVVYPSVTTVYTVTGTYTNTGCRSTAYTTITVVPTPTVSVTGPDSTICSGAPTTLSADGAVNFIWNPGNISGNTVTVIPLSNTVYTATGSNGACSNIGLVSLNVAPAPTVITTQSSTMICVGQSLVLSSTGADTYTYSPGDVTGETAIFNPIVTTIYTITGKGIGCIGRTVVTVSLGLCDNVNDHVFDGNLKLYPNPAKESTRIDFGKLFTGEVSIYNAIGQLLINNKVSELEAIDINLIDFEKGVYLLRVNSIDNKTVTLKLIKH